MRSFYGYLDSGIPRPGPFMNHFPGWRVRFRIIKTNVIQAVLTSMTCARKTNWNHVWLASSMSYQPNLSAPDWAGGGNFLCFCNVCQTNRAIITKFWVPFHASVCKYEFRSFSGRKWCQTVRMTSCSTNFDVNLVITRTANFFHKMA